MLPPASAVKEFTGLRWRRMIMSLWSRLGIGGSAEATAGGQRSCCEAKGYFAMPMLTYLLFHVAQSSSKETNSLLRQKQHPS